MNNASIYLKPRERQAERGLQVLQGVDVARANLHGDVFELEGLGERVGGDLHGEPEQP